MVREEPGASFGRRLGALGLAAALLVGTLVVGYVVWSVFEWRHSRTPAYRILGLQVVTRDGGHPVGIGRSLLRSGLLLPLLVVPTVLVGSVILLCFAFGASPPDGLFSQPLRAPWDVLTATAVRDRRARPRLDLGPEYQPGRPVDVTGLAPVDLSHPNGHALN